MQRERERERKREKREMDRENAPGKTKRVSMDTDKDKQEGKTYKSTKGQKKNTEANETKLRLNKNSKKNPCSPSLQIPAVTN